MVCYSVAMKVYPSKLSELPGTNPEELMKLARYEYHLIQKKTPRRVAYVRPKYFVKDKIFVNTFREHLNQKSPKERVRRLKLYACAIDVLRNSADTPDTVYTNIDKDISLHRFYGQTKTGNHYDVQIKENKRTNRKDFMSVFPIKKPGK